METVNARQGTGERTATRVPAYRFGVVLLLLLATFIFLAAGPTGDWVPLVAVVLQGATLLAAFAASGVGRRLWRLALVVVLAALVSVVIINSLVRRRVIDLRTVLGAVCVYVLIGMTWSFAFTAVGTFDSRAFFAQQSHATVADYLYFSFVTMTTTGYGDLTAAHGFGRALAVLEALIGQLYLVTVIALLVSNLGRRGRATQPEV
jgi:hypothetical protein